MNGHFPRKIRLRSIVDARRAGQLVGSYDDDGTTQARETNDFDEITSITGGWVTPEYDRAGNMTLYPRPSGEGQGEGLDMVYDAWNRLVAVYGCVSDGLVRYWKFDEGEGTTATDSSGTGADGTLPTGSEPVWTDDGQSGGALGSTGSTTA